MKCRACGFEHSPLVRCEQAARQRKVAEVKAMVVAKPEVVHIKREVVETKPVVETPKVETSPMVETAKAGSRHGKHADPEKHREKMRELMRAKRAAAKQAGFQPMPRTPTA